MSRRDRDRSFRKALARNFLARATGPLCPDPETLAAYHENALAPEELLSWNQHFAGCLRCQELLKHLAATDNQALPSLETGKPATARPSCTVTAAPRSRLRLWWASYWRWAVPAGALAAGLLVWVAIRQRPNLEMAKNQQTPPLSEETRNPSPAPRNAGARQPEASRKADGGPAQEILERVPAAHASKERAKGTLEKRGLAPPQANAQRSVPSAAAANGHDQDAAGAQSAKGPSGNLFYGDGSGRPVVKSREEESVSDSAARLQQEPRAMSPKGVTQSVVVRSEAASAESMEGKAPGIGGTLPAPSEKLRDFKSKGAFLRASIESPVMILAPEGRVLWRAGMAGMIERSADGGRSWVAQRSGVGADLLAGSAVSDEVCWIIGRAGTVLRTTDGGTHWLKLGSPSSQDLAAVRATDAQQAVIFDATKQRAYKTTDGGASWAPLPAE